MLVYPYLQALQILPVCNQDGREPLHELVALYSAPPCSEDTPLPDLGRALAQSRPAQLVATQEEEGEEERKQELVGKEQEERSDENSSKRRSRRKKKQRKF